MSACMYKTLSKGIVLKLLQWSMLETGNEGDCVRWKNDLLTTPSLITTSAYYRMCLFRVPLLLIEVPVHIASHLVQLMSLRPG